MAVKKKQEMRRCIMMLKPDFTAYTAAAAAELESVLRVDQIGTSSLAQEKDVKCNFSPADGSISISVATVRVLCADSGHDSVSINDHFISVAFGFAAGWSLAREPKNSELSFEERLDKNYYNAAALDKCAVAAMQLQLSSQFHHDVLRELGLMGHQKADMLWGLAWERGHAEGHKAVWEEAQELARLLR